MRDDEAFDEHYRVYKAKMIIWNSQWLFKSRRRMVTVNLSSPVEMFARDRERLYGILQSMTFSR